jgi:CheY-like chemotaxis protein
VDGGAQYRILLAEDEAVVAMDLQDQLASAGFDVVLARSVDEALGVLSRGERVDLAILDVRLRGDVDGVELGGRLRTEARLPHLYLTAYSDEISLRRMAETRPFTILAKPVRAERVLSAVRAALRLG